MHRPIQIPACFNPCGFIITDKEYSVKRKVQFLANCAYIINKDKQDDWNKLFGVCFGIKGIHQNSIRFGWRWSIAKQMIELCTIEYRNDIATREYMRDCDMALGGTAEFEIKYKMCADGIIRYEFYFNGTKCCESFVDKVGALCYFGCGLYFGGKSTAPHKISVWFKKM